eukprot:g13791.t1
MKVIACIAGLVLLGEAGVDAHRVKALDTVSIDARGDVSGDEKEAAARAINFLEQEHHGDEKQDANVKPKTSKRAAFLAAAADKHFLQKLPDRTQVRSAISSTWAKFWSWLMRMRGQSKKSTTPAEVGEGMETDETQQASLGSEAQGKVESIPAADETEQQERAKDLGTSETSPKGEAEKREEPSKQNLEKKTLETSPEGEADAVKAAALVKAAAPVAAAVKAAAPAAPVANAVKAEEVQGLQIGKKPTQKERTEGEVTVTYEDSTGNIDEKTIPMFVYNGVLYAKGDTQWLNPEKMMLEMISG